MNWWRKSGRKWAEFGIGMLSFPAVTFGLHSLFFHTGKFVVPAEVLVQDKGAKVRELKVYVLKHSGLFFLSSSGWFPFHHLCVLLCNANKRWAEQTVSLLLWLRGCFHIQMRGVGLLRRSRFVVVGANKGILTPGSVVPLNKATMCCLTSYTQQRLITYQEDMFHGNAWPWAPVNV